MQEMARAFPLFEETSLVFEAEDPNIEQYTKVAAVVQNAILCYHVIYDQKKKKGLLPRHHWIIFFKKIKLNPTRNQNLGHQGQA